MWSDNRDPPWPACHPSLRSRCRELSPAAKQTLCQNPARPEHEYRIRERPLGSSLSPLHFLARKPSRQENRFLHASFVRLAPAGDVVGCAVIHRRADKRQSQRQRHPTEEMVKFERYQALIMIHADDGIVSALRGVMKQTVRRQWSVHGDAFLLRRFDSGRNNFDFLTAENAFFPGVRIQRCYRNAWPGNSKRILQAGMREFYRASNILSRQAARDFGKSDMAGHRDHAQFRADEHHTALGGPTQFG